MSRDKQRIAKAKTLDFIIHRHPRRAVTTRVHAKRASSEP